MHSRLIYWQRTQDQWYEVHRLLRGGKRGRVQKKRRKRTSESFFVAVGEKEKKRVHNPLGSFGPREGCSLATLCHLCQHLHL
jgi:hypothetical protein